MLRNPVSDENAVPTSAVRKGSKRGLGGVSVNAQKKSQGLGMTSNRRRKALGDITNRSQNASKQVVKQTKMNMTSLQVEDPEIMPNPLPKVYEEPQLDFTDHELELLNGKGRGKDPLKEMFANEPLQFAMPQIPMPNVRAFEEEDTHVSVPDVRFSSLELLPVDDFQLEDGY